MLNDMFTILRGFEGSMFFSGAVLGLFETVMLVMRREDYRELYPGSDGAAPHSRLELMENYRDGLQLNYFLLF